MNKNKRIIQKVVCNEDHFGFVGNPKDEKYFHPKPKVLNIFPVEGDSELLGREVIKRDLSEVVKFRFDPVNVCNLACIFCTSDLQAKHSQISTDAFEKILKKISSTCERISLGCHFEPLMSKNIHKYFDILKNYKEKHFIKKPIITMITNGLLLNKRNIDLI